MNKAKPIKKILTYLIAFVWLANGLLCKVLNLVPRHEVIVERIIGTDYSKTMIILIGIAEIIMAIWILSGYKSKLNSITQIVVVIVMNVIEIILVPDLLLWGKANLMFAILFVSVVYYNGFKLKNT